MRMGLHLYKGKGREGDRYMYISNNMAMHMCIAVQRRATLSAWHKLFGSTNHIPKSAREVLAESEIGGARADRASSRHGRHS